MGIRIGNVGIDTNDMAKAAEFLAEGNRIPGRLVRRDIDLP